MKHGTRITIIIAIAIVVYYVIRRTVRTMVRHALERTMDDVPEAEIKKRGETLTWIFYTTAKIIITVVALVLILSEVGINVGAILAGFGVAGIAVAFAAQSFIKDIIAEDDP